MVSHVKITLSNSVSQHPLWYDVMTKPTQEHRLKSETRLLIIQALIQTPDMTRTQIARAINRKKSPHLTTVLNQMVEEGILQCHIIQFHNGVSGYVYSLTEAYIGGINS